MEQDVTPEFNFEESSYIAPGATFPGFTGIESKDPKVESSTTQIKTVLDAMAFEQISIAFGAAADLEYQKGKNLEGREPPNQPLHTRVRALLSMFYWRSIKANESGFAKLDFSWNTVTDGINPPLVTSNNVMLTTLPFVDQLYRTGPVILTAIINGVSTTYEICNDGWTWDNNITMKKKRCAGLTSYSYIAVENAEPKVTIPTENVAEALSFFEGSPVVSIDCYLRRAQQGGENVDPATAQHIKLSSVIGTAYAPNAKSIMASLNSFTVDTSVAIPT